MSSPSRSSSPSAGTRPIGVSTVSPSPSQRRKTHSSTRLFSPKPGHRNLPSSSLRNQLTKKIRGIWSRVALAHLEPVLEVVGHVVAAERQHRHRVEAQLADLAGGRGGRLRRHRRAEERRRAPSRRPRSPAASTVARRPPNRKASIGTPAGSSHSGAIDGHWPAGVVKRAFGCAAGSVRLGRPVVALPVDRVRGRLAGHALPPDVAVVGQRAVGEDRVALDRVHRVRVGLVARCRARRRRSRPRG